MRLLYEPLNIELDFLKDRIIELVIEDKDYFSQVIFELYDSAGGFGEKWIASLDNAPISFRKHISIIDNLFLFDPGKSRPIQTALTKYILSVAKNPDYIERGEELVSRVEQFGLELVDELGFNFEVSSDGIAEIDALIKALNLRPFVESDLLIEKVLASFDVLSSLTDASLFVTINLEQFMELETMTSFLKELSYRDYKLLLLTSDQSDCAMDKRIIVDKGQLVI